MCRVISTNETTKSGTTSIYILLDRYNFANTASIGLLGSLDILLSRLMLLIHAPINPLDFTRRFRTFPPILINPPKCPDQPLICLARTIP